MTLDEALRQVPEKYRMALLLCYLEGKTQEEAAQRIGCPLGTIRSRLARGRDLLRSILERRGMRLTITALTAALVANGAKAILYGASSDMQQLLAMMKIEKLYTIAKSEAELKLQLNA